MGFRCRCTLLTLTSPVFDPGHVRNSWATVTSMEECRTVARFVGFGGHYGQSSGQGRIWPRAPSSRLRSRRRAAVGPPGRPARAQPGRQAHKQTSANTDGQASGFDTFMPADSRNMQTFVDLSSTGCRLARSDPESHHRSPSTAHDDCQARHYGCQAYSLHRLLLNKQN